MGLVVAMRGDNIGLNAMCSFKHCQMQIQQTHPKHQISPWRISPKTKQCILYIALIVQIQMLNYTTHFLKF